MKVLHPDIRPIALGVDMDSVLLNTDVAWKAYFDRNADAHRHAGQYGEVTHWNGPKDLCEECFRAGCNDPWLLLATPENEGASKAIAHLTESGVITPTLVTHRRNDLQGAVIARLQALDIHQYFTEVIVGGGSKLKTCQKKKLDALVDDAPHNLIELTGSHVLPIIFDQPYNRAINHREITGVRVRGWGELASFLIKWHGGYLPTTYMREFVA